MGVGFIIPIFWLLLSCFYHSNDGLTLICCAVVAKLGVSESMKCTITVCISTLLCYTPLMLVIELQSVIGRCYVEILVLFGWKCHVVQAINDSTVCFSG